MSTHGKSWIAFAYAVAVVLLPLFTGDRSVDPAELVAVAIAITTAVATWLVPLVPSMPGIKTAVAAALAGLQIAATLILDGTLATDDVLLIAATVLGALGIAVAPAASSTGVAVGWGSDSRTA